MLGSWALGNDVEIRTRTVAGIDITVPRWQRRRGWTVGIVLASGEVVARLFWQLADAHR